jgi:hypothetical protein
MNMIFQRENARDVFDELMPLFEQHWREIAHYNDIALAPDREAYYAAEDVGALRVFTLRDGLRLIGYGVYFVKHNLHYSGCLMAAQDVLFLLPEFRKSRLGLSLITQCDAALATEGVQVVHQHVKLAHDFGPLLKRIGYEAIETIYVKRLDLWPSTQ